MTVLVALALSGAACNIFSRIEAIGIARLNSTMAPATESKHYNDWPNTQGVSGKHLAGILSDLTSSTSIMKKDDQSNSK